MTYEKVYKELCSLCLDEFKKEFVKYEPAIPPYVTSAVPRAIVVYFKNGSQLIWQANESEED